jgi:hypothetical protein
MRYPQELAGTKKSHVDNTFIFGVFCGVIISSILIVAL